MSYQYAKDNMKLAEEARTFFYCRQENREFEFVGQGITSFKTYFSECRQSEAYACEQSISKI